MKRFLVFAILAAMLLGASFASAAELKVSGEAKVDAQWTDNRDARDGENDGLNEDDFDIRQRYRILFRYSASENLSAVIQLQYGGFTQGDGATSMVWGNAATGGQIDTDANNAITLKRAYIEFKWPDTKLLFQAGKLSLALPNQFGSAILGANTNTFLATAPITDNVAFLAGYARALDATGRNNGTTAEQSDDEFDHVFLAVPLTFDGLKIVPFADVSILGQNALTGVKASNVVGVSLTTPGFTGFQKDHVYPWWVGSTLEMTMFDPFVLKGEFNYGAISDDGERNDRSGWLADLELSYTGLEWFVPKIFGLYATGENDNTSDGSERMPTVADDFAWGTYYFGGSDLLTGDRDTPLATGLWTVGVGLTKIKFIDKLTHDAYVLYIQGTNDDELVRKAPGYLTFSNDLTTKDHLWEFDFNSKYMIYDQLAAIVELSYLINDLDEDTWGRDSDDSWKIGVGLQYKF